MWVWFFDVCFSDVKNGVPPLRPGSPDAMNRGDVPATVVRSDYHVNLKMLAADRPISGSGEKLDLYRAGTLAQSL